MRPESTQVMDPQKIRLGVDEYIPACLIVLYGGSIGQKFDVTDEETFMGRDENNSVVFSQADVSRRHAKVVMKKGDFVLVDLDSTNGTYVNDEPVAMRHLSNGDLVRVGGMILKFLKGDNIERLYHEEIYQMTITDGLTRLANKRCMWDFLHRELSRARRHERPLSVIMMDLDHFKLVNDQYGHLAGDFVLQQLAQVVGRNIRKEELFSRYGGEEFVIVLPECHAEGCKIAADKIRMLVQGALFEFGDITIPVTISIGCASLNDGIDGAESFIEMADSNLYKAKNMGRNTVVA